MNTNQQFLDLGFTRQRMTLGDIANEITVPLPAVLEAATQMAGSAARAAFRRRWDVLSSWSHLIEPGPPMMLHAEVDTPPPLSTPEDATFPSVTLADPAVSPRVNSAIGFAWKMSLQKLMTMSPESLGNTMIVLAEHAADGFEDILTDALEAATFQSAQREASALSATSLASAMNKHTVLRTPNGGVGPAATVLLCAADTAVTYASAFTRPVPGLSVVISRLLPSGRWYLLPEPMRGPLALAAGQDLSIDDKRLSLTAAMTYDVRFFVLGGSAPQIFTAADNSPRWTIKGGA